MLGRSIERVAGLVSTARFCARLVPPYTLGYLPALRRARRLCHRHRFTPAEAFRLGLFQRRVRPPGDRFISREDFTKLQMVLNPLWWAPILRDKGMFYRHCLDYNVPSVGMLALLFAGGVGWAPDVGLINGRPAWLRLLEGLPEEFVIKPAQGSYGKGVNVYRRCDGLFVDASGMQTDVEQLYVALLAQARRGQGLVIQRRLLNHPAIVELTGCEYLQTVRIITLAWPGGAIDVLHAHFKPIVGQHIVDTYLSGLLGNVEATVDLEDGRIAAANRIMDTGIGIVPVPEHPQTKRPLVGFAMPFWPQALRLARESARRFLPVRAIGWDVALTAEGPLIVEGNVWFDPPNQHATMPVVVAALRAACCCAERPGGGVAAHRQGRSAPVLTGSETAF